MKVMPDRLKEMANAILKGLGVPNEEAALVAEGLVYADMRGIHTHGVYFLKLLSDRIEANMVSIPTRLTLIRDDETTALIDGGNGLGQVAAKRAMLICIERARDHGVGLTLVRNTNHIGSLAFYTLMAAEQEMVGIFGCNSAPSMAPWGGAGPFVGTNPLSIAIPGGSEAHVILDMASSVVARGKIRRMERLKERIPVGWALDEKGVPTTDPGAAMRGTVLPIGGPKGFGLALVIDILAGMLSGSSYGPDVKTFHQLSGPTGIGLFSMAIDMSRFMPLDEFRQLMASHIESLREVRKADGVSRIYFPGEIEYEEEKRSRAEGVDVDPMVAESLNQILEKTNSPLRLTEE
jgi:LDH2 family malate/lactate/ureidoglycolate dehydrogenase